MSETAFVLIVNDQAQQAEALADELRGEGHFPHIASSRDEALDSIRARRPDVIIVDEGLSRGEAGLTFVQAAQRLAADAQIILLNGAEGGSPGTAEVSAQAADAAEGLPEPVGPDRIRQAVADAAELAKRHRQQRALAEQAEQRIEFEGLVTANPQMKRIIKTVTRIADSKLTVLILGDSGTGKELIARAIHRHSPRRDKPYRAINCAGLNENLLETELFGHRKGAFTGAISDRKGLFEVVDGGTLFLDEVGDMPLPMQAKLLRTLENGEIIPVGSNEVRQVDVRVVAATRRDIRAMVEATEFRDDLFYRLNGALIRIPALRERREDVPLLIEHFIREASRVHGKSVEGVSPDAVRRLTSHQWLGNVRELRSVVDQMVVLADAPQLGVDDLPEHLRSPTDIVPAGGLSTAGLTMEQMERMHIASTLKLTGGNREKTAKMLGIGARTLYRKLREYGLQ